MLPVDTYWGCQRLRLLCLRRQRIRADCVPRGCRYPVIRYGIPKIVVVAIRLGESDRAVGDPERGAEIPKEPRTPLMTRIARTRDGIVALTRLLENAKSTQAEDELALNIVDARLAMEY